MSKKRVKYKKRKKKESSMEASKVSFSKETETRLKASQLGLTRKHKRELRLQAVYEYIRSQPTGLPIKLEYIISAAGYNTKDESTYQSGWSFVTTAVNRGELIREKIPNSNKSYWWIPGDARVVQPAKEIKSTPVPDLTEVGATTDNMQPSETPEVVQNAREMTITPLYPVRPDVTLASPDVFKHIEDEARQFAWDTGSDSVREFIKYLKEKIQW